ncbi:hypothetical protein QUF74_11115 [Candidatus Halobeggiatoa sp. HSG11]|nr:hypothetical protein [Candidatus Halobeggiatoa sp. HSG11]
MNKNFIIFIIFIVVVIFFYQKTNNASENERVFWESIDNCGTNECYQYYLSKYPQGSFSDLAKNMFELKNANMKELKGGLPKDNKLSTSSSDQHLNNPLVKSEKPVSDSSQFQWETISTQSNQQQVTYYGKKGAYSIDYETGTYIGCAEAGPITLRSDKKVGSSSWKNSNHLYVVNNKGVVIYRNDKFYWSDTFKKQEKGIHVVDNKKHCKALMRTLK